MTAHNRVFIGIAGGSTSGKTTLTAELARQWGDRVATLSYDEYYISRSKRPPVVEEESPEIYNNNAFLRDLKRLKVGQPIEIASDSRETAQLGVGTRRVEPRPIILVEGYLIFHDPEVKSLFDKKFFVELSENEMVKRRIQRRDPLNPSRFDTDDYIQNVMLTGHRKYVLPQKNFVDVILDGKLSVKELAKKLELALQTTGLL